MEWSRRACVSVVSVTLSTVFAAASSGAVSEADAVRLFLQQSPQAGRAPLVSQSVDAALRVDSRIPNPSVAYQVEDVAGIRDEFLTLQQVLPVTGRRGLLDRRAEVAAAAATLSAEHELLDDAYALKRAFHDVLYRERVAERFAHAAGMLEQTVEILVKREGEGAGSGYEVLRAEQELAEVRLAMAEADAALALARARFGAFYGPAESMEAASLDGELEPSGPMPDVEQAVDLALVQRLDLRSLTAERERLELERKAARRNRLPEPVVTAGWKRVAVLGQEDTGYIAALSVPLPLFERGRDAAAAAEADGARVELETEILQRRIRAEVAAAVARERLARQAARATGEELERGADLLLGIARRRYDEGESGILELLDAQRISLATHLRVLAARFEARNAVIDRDRAIGKEVEP